MESDVRKAKPVKVNGKARSRAKVPKNRRSVLAMYRKPS
jgi:hypothetical protein